VLKSLTETADPEFLGLHLRPRLCDVFVCQILEWNNDWLVDDVNFMTHRNTNDATQFAENENGTDNCNGGKESRAGDKSVNRSFGLTDLWSIRRNSRTFRIHNRIPRL
jgi:hypothetical protein